MIRDYLHRLATPGRFSPRAALIGSILAMLVVLALDLMAPAEIRLHALYIFPLAVIALHCERTSMVSGGLGLSVAFQLSNFSFHQIPEAPLITDALIAFASSVLTIVLARAVRENYLATAQLAVTDSLTGLRNRRSFESIVDMEIARQRRYGGVFSLALLDLDDFKDLNDSAGHHVGDKALRLLAEVLREHTRKSDLTARLGGDEFAILMANTRERDSKSLCEQLAAHIAKAMADAGFAVTASIGYMTFERVPGSTSDALQQADQAMYAAKADRKRRR